MSRDVRETLTSPAPHAGGEPEQPGGLHFETAPTAWAILLTCQGWSSRYLVPPSLRRRRTTKAMVSTTPAVANNSHCHPSKEPETPSKVIAAKRKSDIHCASEKSKTCQRSGSPRIKYRQNRTGTKLPR